MFRTRPGGSQGSQKFRYSYLSGLVQDFDIDMTRIEKVTATVVPAPINFSRPLAIWPRRFRNFLTRTDVCLTHLHEVLRQGWGGHGGQVRLALSLLCALAALHVPRCAKCLHRSFDAKVTASLCQLLLLRLVFRPR